MPLTPPAVRASVSAKPAGGLKDGTESRDKKKSGAGENDRGLDKECPSMTQSTASDTVAIPTLDLKAAIPDDPRRDRPSDPNGRREPSVRAWSRGRAFGARDRLVLRRRARSAAPRVPTRCCCRFWPWKSGRETRSSPRLTPFSPPPAPFGGLARSRCSSTSNPTPTTSTPKRLKARSLLELKESSRSIFTAKPPTWARSTKSRKHNLFILEDAAQAIGASQVGRRAALSAMSRPLVFILRRTSARSATPA